MQLSSDHAKDRGKNYLHWDKMQYQSVPDGLDSRLQLWHLTKFRRKSAYRKLPFSSFDNSPFVYWIPDPIMHRLHQIDQMGSGNIQVDELVTNPGTKDRYLVSSLIREAITSSQLEGASTTYAVAKAMLRENRKPRDTHEQMIYNNYQAMAFIKDLKDETLNSDLLLEIHRIITEGTLEDPTSEGRFRNSGEVVGVYDERDGTQLHEGAPAEALRDRMEAIYQFANADEKATGEFLHPAVKAILLHFMIAYEHPFMDGNGRTARALFYWSMLRSGYWMIEFLSISSIIKTAPVKYTKAFLYTETDENDTTYFIDFNTRILLVALNDLQKYIGRKSAEVERVHSLLGDSDLSTLFNHRQMAVISSAMRNSGGVYTIESHANSQKISNPTARTDLLGLSEHGILTKRQSGNKFVFRAAGNLEALLQRITEKI